MRIAGIIHNDIANGPGLRCTVFFQGCKHHCPGCHSPHTWPMNTGTLMTQEQLREEVSRNPLDRGLTLSGGDPLFQAEKIAPWLAELKSSGRFNHVMLYTGFGVEELHAVIDVEPNAPDLPRHAVISILENCDILITDRFEESLRTLSGKFRGSTNQRVVVPVNDGRHGIRLFDITEQWEDECYDEK